MINNKKTQPQLRNLRTSLFLTPSITLALTTFAFLFLQYHGLTYKLIVGLAIDIVASICLMFLASLFLRFPPSTWWATILHFILLPAISIVLMGVSFQLVIISPAQGWQTLPVPPEKASKFLSDSKLNIFGSTLYIQSVSGKSFAFDCVTYQGCEWSDIASLSSGNSQSENLDSCAPYGKPVLLLTPPLLVKPIDQVQTRSCGPDYEIQNKYVLLSDGTILASSRYWSVYEPIYGTLSFAVLGFIAGVTTSITTLVVRNKKKRLQTPANNAIPDSAEM